MFVYADNAATTHIDPDVVKAMMPALGELYGNPSTIYSKGREAREALDKAREQVAKAINCRPQEIYFTSCGTESDNWAIRGITKHYAAKKGKHIISTNIEHHAVLETLKAMEKEGYEVTFLPVNEEGFITAQQVEDAIRPDTVLITVMTANNEIGSIQPIEEIAKVAKEHNVFFHTDAVQAVGHIPVDVQKMGVDLLSLSGHKFHAPKGVGALYVRRGVLPDNLMNGGGQERSRRPGTENMAGILAIGAAIEKATANLERDMAYVASLRDRLIDGIVKAIPHCKVNTPSHDRLPGTVNVSIKYIEGESMLLLLDMNGICATSGSACASGDLDPSHVLLAIGLPHEIAHGSVRFSFCTENTMEEVEYILEVLPKIAQRLREMSPLWENVKNQETL
ncbi:MAG: cysteine desulfurase NifS [Clostridia bacterium]|nr:cysteine desulfurase NifS [Clostridia bacterium]